MIAVVLLSEQPQNHLVYFFNWQFNCKCGAFAFFAFYFYVAVYGFWL